MNKHCAICGKTSDLFELKFDVNDTDAQEEFSRFVCGSCWEVIAKIAKLAIMPMIQAAVNDAIRTAQEPDDGSYAEYRHRYGKS